MTLHQKNALAVWMNPNQVDEPKSGESRFTIKCGGDGDSTGLDDSPVFLKEMSGYYQFLLNEMGNQETYLKHKLNW